jgi:hypothetical protein
MEKTLEQLIQMLRDASPTLWAAAQAKIQAEIYTSAFWAWVLGGIAVASIAFVVFLLWRYSEMDYNAQDEVSILSFLVGIAALVCLVGSLVNIYHYQMLSRATDYYAMHALADLVQAAH